MSLTKDDLQQIKTVVHEVVTETVEPRFISIDGQLGAIREDIDDLAVAMTKDINALQDDVTVIKDMVKDHSFRITRLEHHVFPGKP